MGQLAGILMITAFFVFELGTLACAAYLAYVLIQWRKYKSLLLYVARYSTYLSLSDWDHAYNYSLTQTDLIEAFEYADTHRKKKSGKRYEKPNRYSMPPENKSTSRINPFGYISGDATQDEIRNDMIFDPQEE